MNAVRWPFSTIGGNAVEIAATITNTAENRQ